MIATSPKIYPLTMAQASPEETALRMAASSNLHQSLWIPETSLHGRLRVSFSTTSNFDNDSLPAILYFGPLFGNRWHALYFDTVRPVVLIHLAALR